jgi:tetratricopeptide (TPR) repeat protein
VAEVPESAGQPENKKGPVLGQRVLRGVLLLAAPFVFFAALEVALATLGYGGRYPLFVESQNMPGRLEPNAKVVQRYFPGRDTKLGIDPILFQKTRSADSLRIVVQGGSTAAGFPYGRWAGLAGMLGDRLEAAQPGREIEVISTAMAAVNSYTLLDFVDEIIEIEPDVVLIYAGHNEFLGIFGAGSALTTQRSRAATLAHLKLSRFRVYQLMDVLLSTARQSNAPDEDDEGAGEAKEAKRTDADTRRGQTLMAHAASSAEIPLGGEVFKLGVEQFEGNLRQILSGYQRAGIPVLIGTLASNERNQAPFAGSVSEDVDPAQLKTLLERARRASALGDRTAAREALETLLQLDPGAADVWFMLGKLAAGAGDRDRARNAFRKAKENDRLRFRAPEAFNALIRSLAEEFDAGVVDVEAHLAGSAPLGVVGEELMLEHLHPNARGYFLLADAFHEALEREQFIQKSAYPTRDQAMRDKPITALDHLLANQIVREIRGNFPFRPDRIEVPFPEPRGPIEELAKRLYDDPTQWLASMESLLKLHVRAGRIQEAVVVARVTAQAVPWEWSANLAAGRLLAKLGRQRRALIYLDRSRRADPDNPATLQLLVRTHAALGHDDHVREVLAQLATVDPSHPAVDDLEDWLLNPAEATSPGRDE